MLPRWLPALIALLLLALGVPPAAAHDDPPFVITFPQDVSVTTFHDDWRARRSGGRRHEGNDLMAPKMTEVYAAAAGTVVKVSESARAGRYLIIEHADGWETYYIHLNDDNLGRDDGRASWFLTLAPGIGVGTTVKAGQHIAFTGDSGNAEGAMPHTHFELHHDGVPRNPHPYLVEAWDRATAAIPYPAPPVLSGFYVI
jgi:murein DD-endopeptidase MepM/ murein hydrolase activator NlpD